MLPQQNASSTIRKNVRPYIAPLDFNSPINQFRVATTVTPSSDSASLYRFASSPFTPLPLNSAPFPPLFVISSSLTPKSDVSISPIREVTEHGESNLPMDPGLSILDQFDPLVSKPKVSPEDRSFSFMLTETTPSVETSPSSPASSISTSGYSIQLCLKPAINSEIKPLSQFVERLKKSGESQQINVRTDGIIYCKRIQHPTSQHIQTHSFLAELHIYITNSNELITLSDISLQTTVSQVFQKLQDKLAFDFDQAMLKSFLLEEYLHPDDALCDIEYVYKCVCTFQPIRLVLTKRPKRVMQNDKNNMSLEEFCFSQRTVFNDIYQRLELLHFENETKKNKQKIPSNIKPPCFSSFSQHLEEFREAMNFTLGRFSDEFNHLSNSDDLQLPTKEQIDHIHKIRSCCETVQKRCSNIYSSDFMDKQARLKLYNDALIEQSNDERGRMTPSQDPKVLEQLLLDLLCSLVKYIKAYCEAYLIPYEVAVCSSNNGLAYNMEPDLLPLPVTNVQSRSIIESREPLKIHIERLFSLPSNVHMVCVVANICYGNRVKARRKTRCIPLFRNNYHLSKSIYINERLFFDEVFLCSLEREALVLFEIYVNYLDNNTNSITSTLTEKVLDGFPMHLYGWCSQALFDSERCLINGEYYLGLIDVTTSVPAGFYSLRNIFHRACSTLTISIRHGSFFLPEVHIKDTNRARDFLDMSHDKQERLSRLINESNFLLTDHSVMRMNEIHLDDQKLLSSNPMTEEEFDRAEECQFIWSHRDFLIDKRNVLPKLFSSCPLWDYPTLIEVYSLIQNVQRQRIMDELESLELLLPAFPDMYIRSFAYRSLLSRITNEELRIYLPQILQIIKYDYDFFSCLLEHLLTHCRTDVLLAHALYWQLRQLLVAENVHFIRYYYIFMSLLYVIDDHLRIELANEYDLCRRLEKIGTVVKTMNTNAKQYLDEQFKNINEDFFQSGQRSCHLPCEYGLITNEIQIESCIIFPSFTRPIKIVFNQTDSSDGQYHSMFKTGDDLRQDQVVLQLLACMDKIWKSNNIDFHLTLFNVVQTQDRCGFIEMVTDSETFLKIEEPFGLIKGSFSEHPLYDWLRQQNSTLKDSDFCRAIDNLTYSCAGYCVATYVLGIGDRHNENIMVRKSGQLFHIDFGKFLGDTQKFGWFNRDRTPFVFTDQMLYAMSYGGKSEDAIHRFINICCDAFRTLRQNAPILLILLSYLCSSNVPNLDYKAVRFVYDRLGLSLNYAKSITHFTDLIVTSLDSKWVKWNNLIHKMAVQNLSISNSSSVFSKDRAPSILSSTNTMNPDEMVVSAQIIDYEKEGCESKNYLYKIKVVGRHVSHRYRTYKEFDELCTRLNNQFPLLDLNINFSQQSADDLIAQKRISVLNDFLRRLFQSTNHAHTLNPVQEFFQTNSQDQKFNNKRQKEDRSPSILTIKKPPTVCIQLDHDTKTLSVIVQYANNLPLINNREPKPYCKCFLYPDVKTTKQRGKLANSSRPIFNDRFTYDMNLNEIRKRVLHIEIWNYVLNVGNHVLCTTDIALSEIDWSKKNVNDYLLTYFDQYFMSSNRNVMIPSIHIFSLRFNQDSSCFICTFYDGIRIFNVEPLTQQCFIDVGPTAYAEMLHRTNLIAYIPIDGTTGVASHIVNIYDDHRQSSVLQLSFGSPVISVRISRTRLLVVLLKQIHIFSFPSECRLLHIADTQVNPRGLCELSNDEDLLIAFPCDSRSRGSFIQLMNINEIRGDVSHHRRVVETHKNELAAIALNSSGSLLATASVRGTIIRVFSTTGLCERVFEFQRGLERANIFSIAFNLNSSFLCVSSDTGTVHAYYMQETKLNRMGTLHHALPNTFAGISRFSLNDSCQSICAFSGSNRVIAVCSNGTFHKYILTGGEKCIREEYEMYLQDTDRCLF